MVSLWNAPIRSGCALVLASVLAAAVGGCGKDDNPAGPGDAQSAIVRWELTPQTRSSSTIGDVTATFHSFEEAGDCTLVLYDIDDEIHGVPSYVQFLIPSTICIGAFDAEIEGYTFYGMINESLGAVESLVTGQAPFATGFYSRDDDPSQTGTFEFFVDQLTG